MANRNATGTGDHDIIDGAMLKKIGGLPKIHRFKLAIEESTGAPPAMERMKDWRDRLLFVSDWTQAADSPLSDEDKAKWATYRQALRDLGDTQTPSLVTVSGARREGALDFTSFTFPTSPTGDIL